jgi:hypothetical protein
VGEPQSGALVGVVVFSEVVYGVNAFHDDLDTVIVDGEILMEDRKVKTVDETAVLEKAQTELEAAIDRSGLKNLHETTGKYWGHSRY